MGLSTHCFDVLKAKCEWFLGKNYFQWFCSDLNVLAVKIINRNVFTVNFKKTITAPKTGRVSGTYWLIYITVWILIRRKVFYFNDLIAIRVLLMLKCMILRYWPEKLIEIVIVHENRCFNFYLCCFEANAWILFGRKSWFDSHLNVIASK